MISASFFTSFCGEFAKKKPEVSLEGFLLDTAAATMSGNVADVVGLE